MQGITFFKQCLELLCSLFVIFFAIEDIAPTLNPHDFTLSQLSKLTVPR